MGAMSSTPVAAPAIPGNVRQLDHSGYTIAVCSRLAMASNYAADQNAAAEAPSWAVPGNSSLASAPPGHPPGGMFFSSSRQQEALWTVEGSDVLSSSSYSHSSSSITWEDDNAPLSQHTCRYVSFNTCSDLQSSGALWRLRPSSNGAWHSSSSSSGSVRSSCKQHGSNLGRSTGHVCSGSVSAGAAVQ